MNFILGVMGSHGKIVSTELMEYELHLVVLQQKDYSCGKWGIRETLEASESYARWWPGLGGAGDGGNRQI